MKQDAVTRPFPLPTEWGEGDSTLAGPGNGLEDQP